MAAMTEPGRSRLRISSGRLQKLFSGGVKMKTIVLLLLLCAFSDMAFAQALECPPTPEAGDPLPCYNRTPPELGKRATSKVTTALDRTAVSKKSD
jgi:hypothetical protein